MATAGMQPDPGITVNCCGDAAIHARRAEEAKAQRLALPATRELQKAGSGNNSIMSRWYV